MSMVEALNSFRPCIVATFYFSLVSLTLFILFILIELIHRRLCNVPFEPLLRRTWGKFFNFLTNGFAPTVCIVFALTLILQIWFG